MFRRAFVVTVLVILALACAAAPALAFGVLWSQPATSDSQLATATRGPIVAWKVAAGGGESIEAAQYPREGGAALGEHTIVPAVAGLETWYVAGDGPRYVTVVWKTAGVVSARRVDLGTGSAVYGPVAVCSDAQAAVLRGSGATASLAGVASDGAGGVYVWCTLSPTSATSGVGDTLLNHVSSSGALASPGPGVVVPKGTVKGLAVDSESHAFVLLGKPGRSGLAVQRYATDLTADWDTPATPYNPLLGPPLAATPEPIGIVASATGVIAWREGSWVKVQRFSTTGSRRWLTPSRIAVAGDVRLADDGADGCYLAGPSGSSVIVRRLLSTGAEAPGFPSAIPGLGLPQPEVDAMTADRAGDLTVAYSDVASAGMPGVSRMTSLGRWETASLLPVPEFFTAAAQNGAGGAYVLGGGGGAALLHFADAAASVTVRPAAATVHYGKAVSIVGYYAAGGSPIADADVTVSSVAGGPAASPVKTDAHGFYRTSVRPVSNGAWTAIAAGAAREEALILVAPRVSLALSHLRPSGTRLTEIFTGAVTPAHAGKRLLIQKAIGSGWRTVASGRVDNRSHYRVVWAVPYRTAAYKLRAFIPSHTDHAAGASQTATLRVVIRKG
jgi:hypothetical protein